jgi:hypothetical protein
MYYIHNVPTKFLITKKYLIKSYFSENHDVAGVE